MIDLILRIIFSTSIIYVFIVLALRIFGRKELAQLTTVDLVFILLLSNSVQNAMVGSNSTVYGGITAATTLFVLNFIFKKIMFKNERINKFIQGTPILLIYKGNLQEKKLQKYEISLEELKEAVREHGVDGFSDVDLAMLEIDGNISILSKEFHRQTIVRKKKSKRALTNQN